VATGSGSAQSTITHCQRMLMRLTLPSGVSLAPLVNDR
jgi:hypothetical protein